LVSLNLLQKKNEKAIARIKQQIDKDQHASTLYSLLGKTYAQIGQPQAAETALKRALELQPDDFTPYVLLGDIYAHQNTVDKALVEYQTATKLNPKSAALWTVYGMLSEQAGHRDDAKKAYEKALEISPTSGGAANNLAVIYSDEGENLDRALELARTAKIALPQVGPVSDTLGWIYYKRQLYSSAIPLLQEAIKEDPNHAVFHFHLAATLIEAGKKDQAKVELSKALKLDSTLKARADVQKAMGALAL
jgi:Flp pilus assembly protein TadD